MNGKEFNEFLKTRRTMKLFKQFDMPTEHRSMLIDAVNYSPAQNASRNFIPILVEDQAHREWFIKNIFYMESQWDKTLKINVPREYQLGLLNCSFLVIYLEAHANLPITAHDNINIEKEPKISQLSLRKINLGINMSFLACQSYLLGYDVGFVGCSRGVTVMSTDPGLKMEFSDILEKYDLTSMNSQHDLLPSYAVCVGKAYDIGQYDDEIDKSIKGVRWHDGFYSNRKRHNLNAIENLRTLKNVN